MMPAACRGQLRVPLDVIRALAELGADPDAADERGLTAMHRAARRGRIGAIHALVEVGADLNATRNNGRTARDDAQH